jgi:hypothetical protein
MGQPHQLGAPGGAGRSFRALTQLPHSRVLRFEARPEFIFPGRISAQPGTLWTGDEFRGCGEPGLIELDRCTALFQKEEDVLGAMCHHISHALATTVSRTYVRNHPAMPVSVRSSTTAAVWLPRLRSVVQAWR